MSWGRSGRWLWAVLLAAAIPLGAAEVPRTAAPSIEVVDMPPFFVVDGRGAPEWVHVAFPDGELLAACGKREAVDFAQDFYRYREVVRTLVPAEFRGDLAVPEICILFDRGSTNAMPADLALAARIAAGGPQVELGGVAKVGELPTLHVRANPLPNLTVISEDVRATAIEFGDDWRGFEGSGGARIRLSESFVRQWLARSRPELPDWYVDGICELLPQVSPEYGAIAFRRLRWRGLDLRTGLLKSRLTFQPAELLGVREGDLDHPRRRERAEHLALFLRWALDGDEPARRQKLHALVRRCRSETVTPELLQECLGVSEPVLRDQLDRKLSKVTSRPALLRAPLDAPKDSVIARPAPLADSARILSEWHRLAAEHLAKQPEVRKRYLGQAADQVRRLYEKGSREPGVMAALALAEFEAGARAKAGPLLESAALAPTVRPAVWRALAESRLVEAIAAPAGDDGRLNEEQTSAVLEPALKAVAQASPSPEAYLVLAQTWLIGGQTARAEDLETLREAVRRFPEHALLVRRCADACARHGKLEWAREIVRQGLAAPHPPAEREALELLEIRLEAESPGR